MNRGDRRELIFMHDTDRQRFVETLSEACAKTGWQVHAYLLMSNHFHLVVETPQPSLVAGMKWLLGKWGIPKDSPAGRQRLEQSLEARRGAEEGEEFKPIRRGWCLGDETFRQELLAQMNERIGAEHFGEERAETAEAVAEQIISEELQRRRWQEADLKTRPKGDAEKVAFAARLRAETTLTVGWIAERLGMGTRGRLNHLLYRKRKTGGD